MIKTETQRDQLLKLFSHFGSGVELTNQLDALLTDFYNRLSQDVLVGFFFDGKDIRHIAHKQRDFLLKSAGINKNVEVKAPKAAHANLAPILKGHFDRRIVILRETLISHKLPKDLVEIWIEFEKSFEGQVVS